MINEDGLIICDHCHRELQMGERHTATLGRGFQLAPDGKPKGLFCHWHVAVRRHNTWNNDIHLCSKCRDYLGRLVQKAIITWLGGAK
jgi:hypothetical protein